MLRSTMKNCLAFLIMALFLFMIYPKESFAQIADLPGTEGGDFLKITFTSLGITVGAIALSYLIPMPPSKVHIKASDMRGLNFDPNMNTGSEIAAWRKFEGPIMVKRNWTRDIEFGITRSFQPKYFVLKTQQDSIGIKYSSIKEIKDAESAARQAKVKRIRRFIGWTGVAASISYISGQANYESSTVNTLLSLSAVSLSLVGVLNLVLQSEEEKYFRKWKESNQQEVIDKPISAVSIQPIIRMNTHPDSFAPVLLFGCVIKF